MPRFYFDVKDNELDRDKEGQVLPDLDWARHQAACVALNFASDRIGVSGQLKGNGGAVVVCVRDEADKLRATAQVVVSVRNVE